MCREGERERERETEKERERDTEREREKEGENKQDMMICKYIELCTYIYIYAESTSVCIQDALVYYEMMRIKQPLPWCRQYMFYV